MVSTSVSTKASFNEQLLQEETARKARFLVQVCWISISLNVTLTIITLALALSPTRNVSFASIGSYAFFTAIAVVCKHLAKTGRLTYASWLFLSFGLVVLSLSAAQSGTASPPMLGFLLTISLAIALLKTRETLALTSLCLLFTLGLFLYQNIFGLYTPPVVSEEVGLISNILLNLVIVPIIIAILIIPARSQTRALQAQNARLQAALEELALNQQAGQLVSVQMLGLASELKATASQQTSSSEQQVSVVAELNAAASELTTTASHVSILAEQVSRAISQVASDSEQIEQTTHLSTRQSEEGQLAVNYTVSMSAEVAELQQQQLETLTNLKTKTAKMRRVLDLLKNITEETHLLSLNAAIEAAGAGQHGERFRVVAQEVKTLASRAGHSSQEVVEIIREIETSTDKAVDAVQYGYHKAREMEEIAGRSGKVIEKMQEIAAQSHNQAVLISHAAQEVTELSATIKTATSQQQSASQQVLEALNELSITAEQSASGSRVVSSTAVNIEKVSYNLKVTLAA